MTFDGLDGRSVVVTGGSRGIGAAIVTAFARANAHVCFCHFRDGERADDLAAVLSDLPVTIRHRHCDVSEEAEVAAMADWARREIGPVDILVNCAGIGDDRPFEAMSVAAWDRMIAIHLRGTFLVTRAFFSGMIEQSFGRIISISSQLAYKGSALATHYCAAKAGIIGFTRALAHEGAPRGVLVNAVAPGPIMTDMLMSADEAWRAWKVEQLPARRFGLPAEVADSVLFLASDAGRYFVGQTISPSGGDIML